MQAIASTLDSENSQSVDKDMVVFDYSASNDEESSIKLKSGTLTDKLSSSKTYNNRKCVLEMRAIHTCGYYPVYAPYGKYAGYLPEYTRVYRIKKVEVVVRNYKKRWGKYRSYKTGCEIHDISFTVDHYSRRSSFNKSSRDVNSLTVLFPLSHQYEDYRYGMSFPNPVPVQPRFSSAHAKASNDGIGVNWAIINKYHF